MGDPNPFKPDPRFANLYKDVTIPRPPTVSEEHFRRLPDFLQNSEGRERWKNRFSSDEQYQHSVKQYYRLITGIDDAIGKLVLALRNKDLYDKTHIFFTSDNGFFLGEHGLAGKWWGYEESIRTPPIFKPARKDRVGIVSAMTLNIDILPTLLELIGAPVPETNQGISLIPLIAGVSQKVRTDWFYEHLFEHPLIAKSEGIRTERYKYLKYLGKEKDGEFLFDLYHDPYEEINLAPKPDRRELLQLSRQKLERIKQSLSRAELKS